jgi:hypothetical protein
LSAAMLGRNTGDLFTASASCGATIALKLDRHGVEDGRSTCSLPLTLRLSPENRRLVNMVDVGFDDEMQLTKVDSMSLGNFLTSKKHFTHVRLQP